MEPVATDDVFEADPGGFPHSRSDPGPEKSYEAPDNFPAPGLFHVTRELQGVGFGRCPFEGRRPLPLSPTKGVNLLPTFLPPKVRRYDAWPRQWPLPFRQPTRRE